MQPYTDLSLQCGDCKEKFTSAALLLQHFAYHVSKQREIPPKRRVLTKEVKFLRKKKKKNGNLVEGTTTCNSKTVSSSEFSPVAGTDSSTVSAFSDRHDTDSNTSSTSQLSQVNSLVSENGTGAPVNTDENAQPPCKLSLPLVRLDLQERLENCVMNLTSKKVEIVNNNNLVQLGGTRTDRIDLKDVTSIKTETCVNNSVPTNVENNAVSDDFNPMKYCVITMEETADNKMSCGKEETVKDSKKSSNRKQLTPKKIERNLDGLRKIAPKPDNLTNINNCSKTSNKKKYPCHLCTKVFGWSTDLKRHILVHTGERPFKCKTCFASFTRNFLLQKHQSKIHPCVPPKSDTVVSVAEIKSKESIIEVQNGDDSSVGKENSKQSVIKSGNYDATENASKDSDSEKYENNNINGISGKVQSTMEKNWLQIKNNSERRCSDVEHTEIFSIGPLKAVTT